jgi:uncharacterized protein YjlB
MATNYDRSMGKSELHYFADASDLPLVVHRGALKAGGDKAREAEELFEANRWGGGWRDGIYTHDHFHATTHEVLGIARGQVKVRFDGRDDRVVALAAGDVAIVPAGVSHCNVGASKDLLVVGAYPDGRAPDMQDGTPRDEPEAAKSVKSVPLPAADPVFGPQGPLLQYWQAAK